MLGNRVIMVTGSGGSIGSELCRQIARYGPAKLILYENNEYALYRLHDELSMYFHDVCVLPLAGDVRDHIRVNEVIRDYMPQVIFHAAAYKHVPLMEEHNAWQAARNNAYGTWIVARAALLNDVEKFVLVSTDKAVNPTSIMGATKRLAEMICRALQTEGQTRFETVRFGNVLGSAGSVVPKFQAQIEKGGPVTVTHPEITRFFMSISEAAQLVLQAAAMGEGGEIFVLDMGKSIRIVDLAKDLIRLAGRSDEEIKIEFTGMRKGEKLYEEVLADSEKTRPTHHAKVRIASSREVMPDLLSQIESWLDDTSPRSDRSVRETLQKWIPEYTPHE
jgi:FlaA1/EpsC-like NDP-sugar epimerase